MCFGHVVTPLPSPPNPQGLGGDLPWPWLWADSRRGLPLFLFKVGHLAPESRGTRVHSKATFGSICLLEIVFYYHISKNDNS